MAKIESRWEYCFFCGGSEKEYGSVGGGKRKGFRSEVSEEVASTREVV